MRTSPLFVRLGLCFCLSFSLTISWPSDASAADLPPGMRLIPAGQFVMGSDDAIAWAEEKPAHKVVLKRPFLIDEAEVSNAQFERFVKATGYRTVAERPIRLADIMAQVPKGTAPPPKELLQPGSLVFSLPSGPVDMHDLSQWWHWTPGAQWRAPEGPTSTIKQRADHPVVHMAYEDAAQFCAWAGKRLPTEAEWERAARGGVDGQAYVWGSEKPNDEASRGSWFANIWQGTFPKKNTAVDGFMFTAPAKQYQANAYGLYDMAGNVWEWVADWYDPKAYAGTAGKLTVDPQGPQAALDSQKRRVQRGGSFLCHESYCTRYRSSARQGAAGDSGTSHAGMRCAKSL